MDLCGQHRREVKLLVSALDERVASDLLLSASPLHLIAGRLVTRLQDELSVTEAAAQWAVESWAVSLGLTTPPTESPVLGRVSLSPLLLQSPPAPTPPAVVQSDPVTIRTRTAINPKDGAEAILIPAGSFLMGDDDRTDNPRLAVTLDAYYIYKNLVSVAQYRKFCEATRRKMPEPPEWRWRRDHPEWGWKDDHPIVSVTWVDARAYCEWAGADLPTEAQWEKAARGMDGRKFPWGDTFDGNKLQCSDNYYRDAWRTAPVGSFPFGCSPYGALDMAGNVTEWCLDWYNADNHEMSSSRNPAGPNSGVYRVLRGGSWYDFEEFNFRCSNRGGVAPHLRSKRYGFRCVARATS